MCMWIKKQQLQLDIEQLTGSKLRKQFYKAVYCHPAYLTYMQSPSEYIVWNAGLDKLNQDCERNINLRNADTSLMVENEVEIKSLLLRVKQDSEKPGLKLNIQKTKITASVPIASWQIEGEKWRPWEILFLGSKISMDIDCTMNLKDASSLQGKLWQT